MSILKHIQILVLVLFPACLMGMESTRETIFDRIEHVESELKEVPYLPPLCDEMTDLKKGFVEVEDGKLYYEEEGQGIPLVLITGGPGETHHVFHPYFSQLKDMAHIIYYDQRGTGKSSVDKTGKTYTIKHAVEYLENLRKALKIDKWTVLGWSFGGFLAQCYALTYPEHITGLILISTGDGLKNVKMNPSREQMFISAKESAAIEKIYSALRDDKISETQALYNKDLCGDWKRQHYYKPTPEEFIRMVLYEWSPDAGFNDLMSEDYEKISLDGKFDDFEIPTLITEAKWDLTWDTDKAEFIRKNHPNAQFEYFENSGHKLFADEPEKFFPLLKSFLYKSSKAKIAYKQGNRLTWPMPRSELMCKLLVTTDLVSKDEKERLNLDCYKQALKDNIIDDRVWVYIAYNFIKSKNNYAKCLTALQHLELSQKEIAPAIWQQFGYVLTAWQGHMLDLLGRRDDAIKCYQEALKNNNGRSDDYFDGYMQINKQWLEERLEKPFAWN